MFNGKMKAVTFSYDDGVLQDKRLIEIFNKYNLKCTFNLNSDCFGKPGVLIRNDVSVAHSKPRASEVRAIYEGHEIAVHTLTHPSLKKLPDWKIVREVEEDRLVLSDIAGYEVVGMAYPGGDHCVSDRVIKLVKENTGIEYARGTESTFSFDLPENPIDYKPTIYHCKWQELFELGGKFIDLQADRPQILYIWGHAYEFDIDNTWAKFEEFCKMISGKPDIEYCTNKEVFCMGERKQWKDYNGLLTKLMKASAAKKKAFRK